MKRTTIFLDEALERDLQLMASRERRPMASLVREALATYVANHRTARVPKLSFLGIGTSGHRDTADRHEELLWRDLAPHEPLSSVRRPRRAARARPRTRR
jgi:hypothetical protein